ncbi:MAG: hypothetical protein HY392_01450 [Candidatus Diapherotrites archaeon]|nr:hypothetical protein [Candidatus Diapherotrites archaeon]
MIFEIASNPGKASKESKLALIRQNAHELVKSTKGNVQSHKRAHGERIIRHNPETLFSQRQISEIADNLARNQVEHELNTILTKGGLEAHLMSYLKARGIRIDPRRDKEAIESAVLALLTQYQHRAFNPLEPLPLHIAEREFLKSAKEVRQDSLFEAQTINLVLREAFPGIVFTRNQANALKKWLRDNKPGLDKELEKMYLSFIENDSIPPSDSPKWSGIVHRYAEINRDFIQRGINALAKQFFPSATTKPGGARGQVSMTKPGTRAQRIAAYRPPEKTAKSTASEIRVMQAMSRSLGIPINTVELSFMQIRRENPQMAEELGELHSRHLLRSDTIARLSAKGPLTRRIFLTAVKETGFVKRFGERQVDALARGLCFIGPGGRLIQRAVRAIPSLRRQEIFDFLSNNGLIETGHGGGSVVYLRRPQTKNP